MSSNSLPRARVLFVCLGNICRSPMAEGAFRAAAEKAGLDVDADSVGTANYHVGEPPDQRAIATARANGVDISGLRGRQLSPQDFREFTHIFALDTANLAGIKARAPRDGTARIAMLLDTLPGREGEAVQDPYYGDEEDFAAVWEEVTAAADALVAQLRSEYEQAEERA